MPRLVKITALVAAMGSSFGLAASLLVGQPAAAEPPIPPELEHGQSLCVGVDAEVDEVDVMLPTRLCVPLSNPRIVPPRFDASL